MKLHVVFQLHETVCRLILCPVQLSPKFPAGCFSPKPTLSASSPKQSLAPSPDYPYWLSLPKPTPAVSTITPTLALHVIIHTVAVPLKKLTPVSAIRSSHFRPKVPGRIDACGPHALFLQEKKNRNLKFYKSET